MYFDPRNPPDVKGRVVVFDVPGLPDPLPPVFQPPRHEYASADLGAPGMATEQWYQVNYPTRFGRFDEVLRKGGAAGGVVIFDLPRGRARGLYTFPLLSADPVGVPGLYLDRDAGAAVREAARSGRSATPRVRATTEPAEAYFLIALDRQTLDTLRWLSLRDYIPPAPHCSGKVAIVGHTPLPEVLDLGYLKCLDTNCCYGGWLTALDVDSGQSWQVDEKGEVRA